MKSKIVFIMLLFFCLGNINAQFYERNTYTLNKKFSKRTFIGRYNTPHIFKINTTAITKYKNVADSIGIIEGNVTDIINDSFIINHQHAIYYRDIEWLLNNRAGYKIRLAVASVFLATAVVIGNIAVYDKATYGIPIAVAISSTLIPVLPIGILVFASVPSQVIYTKDYYFSDKNNKDIFKRNNQSQKDIFSR